MAKKVTGYIKLQIPAAKATPAPPVGPALGQKGVNIVQFTKEFNARTADQAGMIIPVISLYTQTEALPSFARLRQLLFLLRRHAIFRLLLQYQIRLRLQLFPRLIFRRSLRQRCQI